MNNDEIRIAVAKLCGWTNIGHGFTGELIGLIKERGFFVVPNYPLSLDACAEFEKGLKSSEHWSFRAELWRITEADPRQVNGEEHNRRYISATALQRCEAFLRMKGKWIE